MTLLYNKLAANFLINCENAFTICIKCQIMYPLLLVACSAKTRHQRRGMAVIFDLSESNLGKSLLSGIPRKARINAASAKKRHAGPALTAFGFFPARKAAFGKIIGYWRRVLVYNETIDGLVGGMPTY
ncbi:hypothetical protein [Paenibacillus sp. MBLB4367]|uniref:hypothetical protein n=1 Tax=Paenibacillus sp. MBLB4367 TaxID=3384767 RepID=UPI003907F500